MNATDVNPADPATAHGGSNAGDNAASPPPAPGEGQTWLGSGELARHRAIPLAAVGHRRAVAPELGSPRTG